ncbi:MAG: AAA family ATPase [Myxococcota bacterium]
MQAQSDLLLYGAKLHSDQLRRALDHIFRSNLALQEKGGRGTPVCIWGTHGVGKTMIVQAYAERMGWDFAYAAPAQFEEMGDLHGLPKLTENADGEERTIFAPPAWVPEGEGPGILLLDDVNRADDRILRGLMQLLQNFEMFSWKLPPKWQVVCTANPEGGDYSVTPMDDAMLTRMLHTTLVFDVKAWAAWATAAGVDARGIAFVLSYPEVVVGDRTTPRSLTQFFEQITSIGDLRAEAELVQMLARSTLDDVTVASFMSFVMNGLEQLVDPEEILDAEDFAPVKARIDALAGDVVEGSRVDLLSVICSRLYLALSRPGYVPGARHRENLVAFLLLDALPNDLRFSLHHDIVQIGPEAMELVTDKRLAELVLSAMGKT